MAFLSGAILVTTEVSSSGTACSLSTTTFSLPVTRLMVNSGRLIDLMLAASMFRRR
ncbi:hypothetical protein D3C76_1882200 [compost metagenome]